MRLRRCKIVATLGPASANSATISALFHAGADLFRINMSHATHEQMRGQAGMIRALQEEQRSEQTAFLFTDVQTPGPIDGIDLARLVKTRWPHIEVLVTSGRPASNIVLPDGVRFTVSVV